MYMSIMVGLTYREDSQGKGFFSIERSGYEHSSNYPVGIDMGYKSSSLYCYSQCSQGMQMRKKYCHVCYRKWYIITL